MESQEKITRQMGSYRNKQQANYRLKNFVVRTIKSDRQLMRFVEDYFKITSATIYRWFRSNDQALTQTGFLSELNELFILKGISQDSLVEKITDENK